MPSGKYNFTATDSPFFDSVFLLRMPCSLVFVLTKSRGRKENGGDGWKEDVAWTGVVKVDEVKKGKNILF